MTRTDPTPATRWLIAGLDELGLQVHPAKIERLQRDGLAPRPLFHRSQSLAGEELWPPGALEHYAAVVPLIRRRHNARELAALIMLGWGYPVGIDLLRHSYAKAYALNGDADDYIDALLDHYQNRGMRVVKVALTHIRSHSQFANTLSAEELAEDLIGSIHGFASGAARRDQLRMMLAANFPQTGEVSDSFLDCVVTLFDLVQREISIPRLLETVRSSSVEDLLRVQPEVSVGLRADFERFGGLDEACSGCRETVGLLVAVAIPVQLRMGDLAFEPIIKAAQLANP